MARSLITDLSLSSQAVIESLDQEGRGIAHVGGKTAFIEGGLPGETVVYSPYHKKPNYELGNAEHILRSSPMRVTPRCPHFGVCGGCSLQHLDVRAQVAAKQRTLEDNLRHIGKVEAETLLPPIYGPTWEYRYRARLSVHYVAKKGEVLVGFHEKKSSFVADMQSCEILPQRISGKVNFSLLTIDFAESPLTVTVNKTMVPRMDITLKKVTYQPISNAVVLEYKAPIKGNGKEIIDLIIA